ncbi:hypothetical protein C8R47DRAFT_998951, partial [Mycena vitilis]
EWKPSSGQWIETLLKDTELSDKHATLCGVCEEVVAPEASQLPPGTLLCDECGHGVVCRQCCFREHAKEPLHTVKDWNGVRWRSTTLRQHGFVFQLGHGGDDCPYPDRLVSSLLVISWGGVQRIHVRYCRCADSEGMARSNWTQIRKNGWFPATLQAPGVCCTFKIA